MRQGRRLTADDPLIDKMKLRIGARAGDVARIVHLISRLEERHIRTDGFDHAGCIIADDAWCLFHLVFGCAYLCVHRIDGNSLDVHQNISAFGLWFFNVEIEKRTLVLNGQIVCESDGFHRSSPCLVNSTVTKTSSVSPVLIRSWTKALSGDRSGKCWVWPLV